MSDVADLKAEVLALRAENAELRKHVRMPDEPLEIDEKDFYVRAFIKWATEEQPEVKRLEAENAKLRELLRELWSCAASLAEDSVYHIEGAVCGCGISCVVNGEDCSAYKLRDRMRELGVDA